MSASFISPLCLLRMSRPPASLQLAAAAEAGEVVVVAAAEAAVGAARPAHLL